MLTKWTLCRGLQGQLAGRRKARRPQGMEPLESRVLLAGMDPVYAGVYDTSGRAYDVSVAGAYAYLVDDTAGLQVIAVGNPGAPTRVGSYDTSGFATGVTIAGSYAYVADGPGGLHVFDISDPTAPVRVGGYDTITWAAAGVSVVGTYAYVAGAFDGLQILNVSNPAAPVLVGSCATGHYANRVSVAGAYAYVADQDGLQIVNVSNPAAPALVGSYDTGSTARDVTVVGDYAYVADFMSGLAIIDVSIPSAPIWVGGHETFALAAQGVDVVGPYAFLADGFGGLVVIDVTDPTLPVRVGGQETSGNAQKVTVAGGYAYVADDTAGLQVFSLAALYGPTAVQVSAASVAENQSAGAVAGTLSTTDPEAGDAFTYALVGGLGSTDNALFEIVGNQLRTTTSFDFEAKPSRSIRVRSTDQLGLWTEKVFTIGITNVNEQPTNVQLSTQTTAEKRPANSLIGTLSTTDPDAGGTFTYMLVEGTGSADNAAFQIAGNQLRAVAPFDFEARNSYSVRVRSTDQGGLWAEREFAIAVTNVNEAPADVQLSASVIAEDAPAGTAVGTFSATDPDAGGSVTHALVLGAGSTDNASFQIVGGELRVQAALDHDTKPMYSIRVRATDQGGLWMDKTFQITVTNVNESPADILLSAQGIAENQPAGTTVGTLSAADPDAGGTFTYALVEGAGSADNAAFEIVGGELRAVAAFDFEMQNSYSVRVRAADQEGLWTEKVFAIAVTNVNESPTGIQLSGASLLENQTAGTLIGLLGSTDPDAGGSFTYALAAGEGSADNAAFWIVGGQLLAAGPFDYEARSSYSIRVRSTDQGGLWTEQAFVVTVADLAVEDAAPPTAALAKAIKAKAGKAPLRFAVQHTDDVAVSAANIGHDDILVTGPRRYKQYAKLFKKGTALDAAAILATYQITAPGGVWDSADNGLYTLWLNAGRTSDAAGKLCAKKKLGTFTVKLGKAVSKAARTVAAEIRPQALAAQGSAGLPFSLDRLFDQVSARDLLG